MNNINNAKSIIWNSATLNAVVRKLRKLNDIEVERTGNTVIVRHRVVNVEFLRAIKNRNYWVTRYDSGLIQHV